MKIQLVKTLSGTFKPAFDSGYELAKKIPVGEIIEYEWKKKRNIKFHRKLFALLNLAYQNQEVYNNIEHMRKDLTVSAGYYDLRHDFEGLEIREPKSISFDNMDENEFSEFYNRIVDVIIKWLGIDRQDIVDEISQYF